MIKIENHCCGCASPAYPCMGNSCPNRNVEVHYCDSCGEELDDIYKSDDEELCINCFEERNEEDDD